MPIDPRRVVRLEDAVRALHQQVNTLLSEVRSLSEQVSAEQREGGHVPGARPAAPVFAAPRAPVAPVASPPVRPVPPADALSGGIDPPPRPRPRPTVPPPPAREPVDLETFFGRYFMIGAAVIILLMGIGTFLSWAIKNDLIVVTPAGRVGLGVIAAGIFTWVGFWLRGRGDVKFGNVLLAIALAIVHLVAWGAGPKLALIPAPVALGLAAVASAALALLALSDEDEQLFVVGVGGALLAPFVTSSGRAAGPSTLIYGWLVITSGLFAMRGHDWQVATRLMGLAGTLYAGVGLIGASWNRTTDRLTPPFFALACTWSAGLLAAAEYRSGLVRVYLVTMVLALLTAAGSTHGVTPLELAPLALAGTVSAYLILRPTSLDMHHWMLDAIVVPLGFLGAALYANGGLSAPNGVAIALIWSLASAGAALMNEQERRGPHWFVFGTTTLAAVGYLLRDDVFLLGVGLVALAGALSVLMRKERVRHLGVPIAVALLVALAQVGEILSVRAAYVRDPFINRGAVLLLLTLLGFWRFFDVLATTRFHGDEEKSGIWLVIARAFLPAALFAWGWFELGRTVSYDVATSLVTLYFAAAGVGSILVGRQRSIALLRQIGLGLCVLAALSAVVRVWGLDSIGIKFATLVLVGLFVLGVGYWYRKPEVREG